VRHDLVIVGGGLAGPPRLADGSGPDVIGVGPDCPADERARFRFLGS